MGEFNRVIQDRFGKASIISQVWTVYAAKVTQNSFKGYVRSHERKRNSEFYKHLDE